eukprot:7026556-Pyramimonas_sp.AAC.1
MIPSPCFSKKSWSWIWRLCQRARGAGQRVGLEALRKKGRWRGQEVCTIWICFYILGVSSDQ